ncbi:hypothetical protein [Radicibacter daui]|uniref:hypothetical protein n=1 Tax=Radicibacter daui TaxID=3064829 RepID=UPI0040468A7E
MEKLVLKFKGEFSLASTGYAFVEVLPSGSADVCVVNFVLTGEEKFRGFDAFRAFRSGELESEIAKSLENLGWKVSDLNFIGANKTDTDE